MVFWMLTLFLLPAIVAEAVLWAYRRFWGLNRAYPAAAALLRTLAYSPCVVGAGHGVLPMPIIPALLMLPDHGDAEIWWLGGFPEIFLALLCFSVSSVLRKEKMGKARLGPGAVSSHQRISF